MKYSILTILLASCSLKPTVYDPTTKRVASAGLSVFTKSQHEDTTITMGDIKIEYKIWGNDEQSVPLSYIRTGGTVDVLKNPLNKVGEGAGTVLKK